MANAIHYVVSISFLEKATPTGAVKKKQEIFSHSLKTNNFPSLHTRHSVMNSLSLLSLPPLSPSFLPPLSPPLSPLYRILKHTLDHIDNYFFWYRVHS